MSTALGNIKAIAKRELTGYFASPVAYVFIVIFLLLCGAFTFLFGGFFERDQASLVSFFMWHPWFYLFLVPAVGMRLWSEERRQGTIELLLTMPITSLQAILGKFLASWAFLLLALGLTFPVWVTVNFLGSPDNGVVVCTYLGSALMAGAYLAIACMTSAMTRNQVVAFIVSVVICLVLVLGGVPRVKEFFDEVYVHHGRQLKPGLFVGQWNHIAFFDELHLDRGHLPTSTRTTSTPRPERSPP